MKRIGVIALVVIAGCVSTPEKPPWWRAAPLDAVIKRMGRYPEANRDYEDVTIYSWSVNLPGRHWMGTSSAELCTMDVATRAKHVTLLSFNGVTEACRVLQDQVGYWDEAE